MGLETGDRIAIPMRNCPEFIITEILAARAGTVVLPFNHKLSDDSIEYAIKHAGIQTIVVGPQFFETIAERAKNEPKQRD
jgi:acyl-CoA synthetase (AMP-forming)/AMP-acid ligase II